MPSLLLLLTLAACGGGDGGSTPPPTQIGAAGMAHVEALGVAEMPQSEVVDSLYQFAGLSVLPQGGDALVPGTYACQHGGTFTYRQPDAQTAVFSFDQCDTGAFVFLSGSASATAAASGPDDTDFQTTALQYVLRTQSTFPRTVTSQTRLRLSSDGGTAVKTGSYTADYRGRSDAVSFVNTYQLQAGTPVLQSSVLDIRTLRFAPGLQFRTLSMQPAAAEVRSAGDGSLVRAQDLSNGTRLDLYGVDGRALVQSKLLSEAEFQAEMDALDRRAAASGAFARAPRRSSIQANPAHTARYASAYSSEPGLSPAQGWKAWA